MSVPEFVKEHLPPTNPPPGQGVITIDQIIGIYVGIASISTPPTEGRTAILTHLEKVILGFTTSLNFGAAT